MKFGLCLVSSCPWRLCEMAVGIAESMHADSIWATDHSLGGVHPPPWADRPTASILNGPDAFTDPFCLGAALGRATTIPYGVCVTDSIRRGPADVARTALTLQHLCQGGFNLGIGSGEAENIAPFGYPYDRPGTPPDNPLTTLPPLLHTARHPPRSCLFYL